MTSTIAGVIVAAGASRRMGQPKALVDLAGRPMLQWVVDAAEGSRLDRVVVVTGPGDADVRSTIAVSRAFFVHHPAPELGTMSSLRAGVAGAGPAGAVMKLVCDQPELTSSDIDALMEAWDRKRYRAARAIYRDGPGHPLLVDRTHLGEVLEQDGDRLLWKLLDNNPEGTQGVEIDRLRPIDVNDKADLDAVRERLAAS